MPKVPVYQGTQVQARPIAAPALAYQDIRVPPGAFDGGAAGMIQAGAKVERFAEGLAVRAIEMAEEADKATAASAFATATEAWRQKSLTDGLYSKTAEGLFADGANPIDTYKSAGSEFDSIGSQVGGKLGNDRQRAIFQNLWQRERDTELGKASNFIAQKNNEWKDVARKRYWTTFDQSAGEIATGIEQDWRTWRNGVGILTEKIKDGATVGATPDELMQKAVEAKTAIASAAVRGWAKTQPDRYAAAEALYSGNIPDPELRALYNSLTPQARSSLFSGVLTEQSKLATISNANREAARAAQRDAAEANVKRFFFDPSVTPEQRQDALAWARMSQHVDEQVVRRMEDFVMSGGRDASRDKASDVLALERAVRNNEVSSDVQAIDYAAKKGLTVSLETMRTRIIPLLESKTDKLFEDAITWGESELGYDKSAAASGLQIFADKADKAAKFRADMLNWRRDNKGGDPWSQAKEVVGRLSKQGNAGAAKVIPTLVQQYRQALTTGNAAAIGSARTALTSTMIEAGYVDPLKAASENFDPIKVIEQLQQGSNK